jgi:hypothetical protein
MTPEINTHSQYLVALALVDLQYVPHSHLIPRTGVIGIPAIIARMQLAGIDIRHRTMNVVRSKDDIIRQNVYFIPDEIRPLLLRAIEQWRDDYEIPVKKPNFFARLIGR